MKVNAVQVGTNIAVKKFITETKLNVLIKDPLVIGYKTKKYITLFKYGVVVFWGVSASVREGFLKELTQYIIQPLKDTCCEEMDVLFPKSKRAIYENKIYLKSLTSEKVALISLILSRSVALEYYETELDKSLQKFEPVMKSLAEKGRSNCSMNNLLKIAGYAMNMRHLTMSQIFLLDRPDLAWEDEELSRFYDVLSNEFEIDDRYDVLKEKLEIIFRNAEFILGFLDAKRSMFLEITIIILIVIEIIIFVFEVWFT